MERKCSACEKEFTEQDKIVAANCGCLVHAFKVACCEFDFCRNCNRQFKVSLNAPLINLSQLKPQKDEKPFEDAMKEMEEKFKEMLEIQRKEMQNNVDETAKRLEEQRKINLEMMKKLNALNSSQGHLLKVFKEQTGDSKKVIEELTKILTKDLDDIKEDMKFVMDEIEGFYEVDEDCACPHAHDHHAKTQFKTK